MNKKTYMLMTALLVCTASLEKAGAQDMQPAGAPIQVECRNGVLLRDGNEITASMEMDLSDLKLGSNEAAVFVPMVVNGTDTLRLPGVGIYGRTRWYQFERLNLRPLSGDGETSVQYKMRPKMLTYTEKVPFRRWMEGSELILMRTDYGCCGAVPGDFAPALLAGYNMTRYEPNYRFIAAVAEEVKTREISGRAYIDFPVNRTELYPTYRNNPAELAKIIATIDSVRNDKDITVKRIFIKGWASPESPWDNNTRLAKGRTETLKQYVQNLYSFPYNFIETDYYPEDWVGLREYVEKSSLPHRNEILMLIDDPTLDPDPKEDKLKKTYPEEYAFLLQTVYPGLRHSDYTIEYTIRGYSDVAEIAEVMRTQPSNLSLNEMYLLAATYMPGSDAYNEVMETAARMYPRDETALVNAAAAAMQRGDFATAERYLSRAGAGAEVLYARGVLAGMQRNYEEAIWYMEQAASKGSEAAEGEIEQLKAAQQYAR